MSSLLLGTLTQKKVRQQKKQIRRNKLTAFVSECERVKGRERKRQSARERARVCERERERERG